MAAADAGKTLVFVATYEERDNVAQMLEEIARAVPHADIVFMDDNSPDGTGQLLDELAKTEKRLTVIHRPSKGGVGSAHRDGITYAYDHRYDILVTLDCDFTHSPADIPKMIEKSAGAGITVGSRYLDPDSLPGWNPVRKTLTHVGHLLTVNLLGVKNDATGAFRVYRLSAIPQAMFDLVKARGYAFFFESLFVATQNNVKIADVPIRLPTRTYGHSKMSLREIQQSVNQLLSLYVGHLTNPAHFRLGKGVGAPDASILDPNGWNEYWERKTHRSTLVYDAIATIYRNLIIKGNLTSVSRREFPSGSRLLHAGCGSGQVDVYLHDHAKITAVDISTSALEIYARENPNAYAIKHASILNLPFPEASFDGAYNIGVIEHFEKNEIGKMLGEFRRVIRPGGKFVTFWPHAYATSAAVLGSMHWVINDVLKRDVRLHPPEPTRIHSAKEARELLEQNGFNLLSYKFGAGDMFVQAVVVGERRA